MTNETEIEKNVREARRWVDVIASNKTFVGLGDACITLVDLLRSSSFAAQFDALLEDIVERSDPDSAINGPLSHGEMCEQLNTARARLRKFVLGEGR